MSCFGGTPVALKEEYLKNTPFFLLAAETDDATILPELAKYAKVAADDAAPVRRSSAAARASLNWG